MKDNGQLTQTVSLRERERAPSPVSSVYAVEDRSPYVGFDIIAVIFVQTFSWTAIMTHYFEGLSNLEVEIKGLLVFVVHCGKNPWVFPVNGGVAVLPVSCEA